MKKRLPLFLALAVLFSVSSCGLFDGDPYFTEIIEGEYDWIRTTGGFAGITITPDSVHYTQKLLIREGKAFLYRNSEVISTFDIKYGKEEWTERKTWIFYEQGLGVPMTYFIPDIAKLKKGTLILFPVCFDCYTFYFKKK